MAKTSDAAEIRKLRERIGNLEHDREERYADLRDATVHTLRQITERCDFLFEQLAEQNLRTLYILHHVSVKRTVSPSGLILDGSSPVEEGPLLVFYRREAESFLAKLEAANAAHAEAQQRAHAAAEDPGKSDGTRPRPALPTIN